MDKRTNASEWKKFVCSCAYICCWRCCRKTEKTTTSETFLLTIFHYDFAWTLCVLKMALFNMFGVCDRRKHKWLVGWLASWWRQRRNIFFAVFRVSRSGHTLLSTFISTKETLFEVSGHVCECVWSLIRNTHMVGYAIGTMQKIRMLKMSDDTVQRKKERNKVNGVANGQKEIDLKLQHIVQVCYMCVCASVFLCVYHCAKCWDALIWCGGGDVLPGNIVTYDASKSTQCYIVSAHNLNAQFFSLSHIVNVGSLLYPN